MINNVVFNILYQILNIIIPLITAPYISRVMTPFEVGVYSYTNSMCGVVAVFMLLGIANYGSRTVAIAANKGKERLQKTFSELYIMQAFSSLVGILLYFVLIVTSATEYRLGMLAQLFYLLSVMLDISWYFVGTGQIKTTVIRGSLIKLLQTIAIFCYVKAPEDLIIYILIMSVGTLLGNAVLWVFVRKDIRFAKVSVKDVSVHIKPNLVLFLPLLASSIFVYMDKIMLGIIASTADLGLYEYAEKIVRVPLTVISAIGAVMMPYISGLLSRNEHTVCKKYMNISMRYLSLLASAMFFGMLAISPELADVYLGEEFLACGQLIQVMSCIVLFSTFANIIRTQWLIPREEDRSYAGAIVAGAVTNLVLNAVLIPLLGSTGAAIGTIGAEFAVFVCHVISVRKQMAVFSFFAQWGYALLVGAIMFLCVEVATAFVKTSLLKLIVGVLVGILFFAIAMLIFVRKDRIEANLEKGGESDDSQ